MSAGSVVPAFALWLLNLVLDTGGQLAFKGAAARASPATFAGWLRTLRDPLVQVGVTCYVVEFAGWLAFLTLVPLSTAVLLSSLNIVTVTIAGRLLFDEPGGRLRTAGILLVTAGVALAGLGANGA